MSEPLSKSDHLKRAKAVKATLEKIANLAIQRDSISSQIKAEYDNLETQHHLNRKAVKHAVAMLKMEEEKRFDYEKTKAIIYDAHGWHFQPDLFADQAPAGNVATLPGIGQENADLLGDVDTRDDPGSDFTDEELDEQEQIAAHG